MKIKWKCVGLIAAVWAVIAFLGFLAVEYTAVFAVLLGGMVVSSVSFGLYSICSEDD